MYTASDGKEYLVTFYNLDMILALGYRINSEIAIKFRKWATSIIKNYMIKGIAYNQKRCLECYKAEEILQIKEEIIKLKSSQKNQISYFAGEELRGFIEIKRYLESAKEQIIIVDNYFGHDYDDVLKEINVYKLIITDPQNKKITTNEIYRVNKTNKFHDRYILVDETCYHLGPSVKDLGKKISTITLVTEKFLIDAIKVYKE